MSSLRRDTAFAGDGRAVRGLHGRNAVVVPGAVIVFIDDEGHDEPDETEDEGLLRDDD